MPSPVNPNAQWQSSGNPQDLAKPITPESLQPVTPLQTPAQPYQETPAENYQATLKSIEQIYADNSAPTKASQDQDLATTTLFSDMDRLLGKRQATARETEASGIKDLKARKGAIDKKLQFLTNEALAIPLQEELAADGTLRTQGSVNSRSAKKLRENTIQALQLSATSMALQGDIDAAKEQIKEAVDAEFGPIEDRIAYVKSFMEINEKRLAREDNERFQRINSQIAERTRILGELKSDRTFIQNTALKAAEFGADEATLEKIRAAATPEQAIVIAGKSLGAAFKNQMEQQAFDNGIKTRTLQIQEQQYNLARRKSILEMAKLGDAAAIKELGYDPNNMPVSVEQLKNYEDQKANILRDLDIINRARQNSIGLGASAGLVKGSFFSSLFNGAGPGPIGTAVTAAKRQDFLSDAQYVVKNLTFDKMQELADKGIKLTPVSEKELRAMGEAANVLVSAARFDEGGNLTGFNMSEQKVQDQMTLVAEHYARAYDDINVQMLLTPEEQKAILSK